MINDEMLEAFANNGNTLREIGSNATAKRLLEDAIMEAIKQELPENSKFEFTNVGWEKDSYTVVGKLKEESGGFFLKFNKDLSKVGFRVDDHINYFRPNEEVSRLLKACIRNVDKQASYIECLIVKKYTSEVRFGNVEYLKKEFNTFAIVECMDMSEGRNTPIQEAFPINVHPDGDIIEYLESRGGNMDNIHVTNN